MSSRMYKLEVIICSTWIADGAVVTGDGMDGKCSCFDQVIVYFISLCFPNCDSFESRTALVEEIQSPT